MRTLLLVAVVTSFIACQKEDGPGEERLAKTFAELILHREQFGRSSSADSLALYRAQVDSILKTHGFTREEFLESFLDLVDSPDRFDALFKSLFTDLQQSSP